eukprot:scaffold8815_cov137-Isochrysis_galbana.AAC.1
MDLAILVPDRGGPCVRLRIRPRHRPVADGRTFSLYKKGDSRDPRNYRPITLLQVDYKILAKILVARMKKVVNNFVSKEQLERTRVRSQTSDDRYRGSYAPLETSPSLPRGGKKNFKY